MTDPRYWTTQWKATRAFVLARDRGLCQIRGPKCNHYATAVDHVEPVADGGDFYNPANLRASCRWCNSWRAALRTNRARGRRYRTSVPTYETRM